jgi:4-amino-4-deoxy-L-arabinose transferase-like glycosyltransferase
LSRWLILPILLIYLWNLGGVGMLGPDEPRYASIGREMAHAGDFVTPVLDGKPWFEKPPLTYWLTALGTKAGLRDEWAARLPEALLSILFLLAFYAVVSREFSSATALTATAILSTCAGWMAYSFAALTDLPMSAALNAAALLTLFPASDPRRSDSRFFSGSLSQGSGFGSGGFAARSGLPPGLLAEAILAGALLGLAILGKGFVPVVLFAPLWIFARGRRIALAVTAFAVASPWFILTYLRNGSAFWDDFFWKQHVARFLTPSLEHVQPWWFYVPVLLAGLFPWTPLIALIPGRKLYRDARLQILLAWVTYGLVFFSASKNKLPGYVLPLLPSLALLLAASITVDDPHERWRRQSRTGWWLALCAFLLIVLPTISGVLPDALASGLSRANVEFAWGGLAFIAAAAIVWFLAAKQGTEVAAAALAIACALGVLYLKQFSFPMLDRTVSVRSFARQHRDELQTACLNNINRAFEYGLNYYVQSPIPQCSAASVPGAPPFRRSIVSMENRALIIAPPPPIPDDPAQ